MNRWIISAFFTALLFFPIALIPNWETGMSREVLPTDDGKSSVVVTIVKKSAPKTEKPATLQKAEKPKEKPKPKEKIPPKPENSIKKKAEDPIPESETEPKTEEPSEIQQAEENQAEAETAENAPKDASAIQENSVGTASEGASPAQEKSAKKYKEYALRRIASKKAYPMAARSQGMTGRVKVHAVVNPDGTLSLAEIESPCAHEILNEAALAAVRKSAPFKKMDAGLPPLELHVVMEFELK